MGAIPIEGVCGSGTVVYCTKLQPWYSGVRIPLPTLRDKCYGSTPVFQTGGKGSIPLFRIWGISIVVELAVWGGKTGVRFIHTPLGIYYNGIITVSKTEDVGPIPAIPIFL